MPDIHIDNFEGDPEMIDFFEKRILECARLSGWSDKIIFEFTLGHLTGRAKTFIIQETQNRRINSSKNLFDSLKNFFRKPSLKQSMSDSAKINLLPGEWINNLAHRLTVAVNRAFTTETSTNALNIIKLNKFFEIIPQDYVIQLKLHGVTDFAQAVEKAQVLQDCTARKRYYIV